jgi:hypothetical protein
MGYWHLFFNKYNSIQYSCHFRSLHQKFGEDKLLKITRKLKGKFPVFFLISSTVSAQSKIPLYLLDSLRDCPKNMMLTIRILQSWMYFLTPQLSWCSQVNSVDTGLITFQVLEGLWASSLGWASSQLWNCFGFV